MTVELRWYWIALAAVITYSWWRGRVEYQKPWAVWAFNLYCRAWDNIWTRLQRHHGPVSPYTYQPKHGDDDERR